MPVAGALKMAATPAAAPHRDVELRLYGLNAIRALFQRRPHAVRKLYLLESRIPQLQPLLKWCVANRIGYNVVEEADLQKLASSTHHEGVVADVLREEPQSLTAWLRDLADGPQCALWLDGVGNPHNLGALIRSAAHFGAGGVLVPAASGLDVSGAAARVAEGAAEAVPFVQAEAATALAALRGHGFTLVATVPTGGVSLYATALPPRLVLIFGAEREGMSAAMLEHADLRLTIPGSGVIDSLNVAASTAVVLGEYWRQHGVSMP